jgi:hypothetical protein
LLQHDGDQPKLVSPKRRTLGAESRLERAEIGRRHGRGRIARGVHREEIGNRLLRPARVIQAPHRGDREHAVAP